MKIDILTLCDNAQEYNGKLVIVGALNEIVVPKVPAIIPELAVVARTIIEDETAERHEIEITASNASTGKEGLLPPFKTILETKGNTGKTVYSNVIVRMNNLTIPEAGKYVVKFRIDTSESDTLLTVRDASAEAKKNSK